MDSVKVYRDNLLAVVRENRAKHAVAFEEAVRGFRAEAREKVGELWLEQEADDGWPTKSVALNLSMPTHHLDEYDTAIQMLEMSVDTEVTLDNHQFRQLVRDEWSWKNVFLSSNAAYIQKSRSL